MSNPIRIRRSTALVLKTCSRRALALGCAMCATIATAVGCGQDTEEITTVSNPIEAALTDDTAPPESAMDPSLNYAGRYGQTENHSTDRFRFDVAAYDSDSEKAKAETLVMSHAAFLSAHAYDAIPSVQTIGTYVKQLDDTLYAGVERAVQDGLQPTVLPKRQILSESLDYLSQHRSAGADEALTVVAAALKFGGASPTVPQDLAAKVDEVQNAFLAMPEYSKPFGFYTWSDELKQIWMQDRLLQQMLPDGESSCALAQAIAADDARKQRYAQLVELYSKLTNPVKSSLLDLLDISSDASCPSQGSRAFLSSSSTPEVKLFEELYPDGVPPTADLMGDLIAAIRAGTVDLKPKAQDGWYQYQLFALETLLVTDKSEERSKIAFMARYKKRLQEAFSTMLVQHRETHAKQADTDLATAAPMPTVPHFRLEPLATVYVRHARSYVFLEAALDKVLGPAFLDKAVAVEAGGPVVETLRSRVQRARDLFFGLYLVSAQDIGMQIKLDQPGDPEQGKWLPLAAAADQWLLHLDSDPVASSDVRVIVPIASLGGSTKYWAVIGVRATLAGYSYIHGTDVSPPKPEDQARVWLPTEQFLEVVSSNTPLSREEFRKLCDDNKTAEAIKTALEARH